MTDDAPARPSDAVLEEAALWFARMRGPEGPALRTQLEDWLARAPEHRLAYNRAAEIFAMGKLLGDPPAGRGPVLPAVRRRRLAALAAAGAGLAVLAAFALLPSPKPADPVLAGTASSKDGPRRFSAAEAPRDVALGEGSFVRLMPGARLLVDLGNAARRILLEAGSARFQVALAARPLRVLAGGALIVGERGSTFAVEAGPAGRLTVRPFAGAVAVTLPGDSAPRRLAAGHSLTFRAVPGMTKSAIKASTPALPAVREFDGATLADVIAAANRTSARPIRLADDGIGRLRVSGVFRVDETDRLAERLARLFGLVADRRSPDEILLRRPHEKSEGRTP